jgi:hypothetical protein
MLPSLAFIGADDALLPFHMPLNSFYCILPCEFSFGDFKPLYGAVINTVEYGVSTLHAAAIRCGLEWAHIDYADLQASTP